MVDKTHRIGVANNREMAEFDRRRALPWTEPQYERLRLAAEALIRSRRSHDALNREGFSVVDGKALWALMRAIDRVRAEDKE